MNAIILAAGLGKRLAHRTKDKPKCMVPVNGRMIIDAMLENLLPLAIDKLIIVTGYLSHVLTTHIQKKWQDRFTIVFIDNPLYESTNNIYSLWLARAHMTGTYLLLESDVLFDNTVLQLNPPPTKNLWFADHFGPQYDGCMLTTGSDFRIKKIEIIREKLARYHTHQFKSIGMLYITNDNQKIISLLRKEIQAKNVQIYYDLFFAKYVSEIEIFAADIHGKKWYEIDDEQDLSTAEKIFKDKT